MPHQRLDLNALRDDELLDLRLADLPLSLDGRWIQACIDRLYAELRAAGIERFRPRVWLSSEWFSPDDVPGIAVPFYLAHDRLMRLERRVMLQVEGGTRRSCMRLLRHEAGHAVDAAFGLRRRRLYRDHFGRFGDPYPDYYRPRPSSRDFVLHLDRWYAQAHPAEDFAETFAVWLTPTSRWRERYAGWPALKKLLAVEQMIEDASGRPPVNRRRRAVEPLGHLKITLREHYHQKKLRYLDDWPDIMDHELRRLFTGDPPGRAGPSAAGFIHRMRREVRERVARGTGAHPYTIDQVLTDTIDRCKELRLRLRADEEHTRADLLIIVTAQTMLYLHRGAQPLAV